MKQEFISYEIAGKPFKGYWAFPEAKEKGEKGIKSPFPAIIVAHAWMGQDPFARQQAERMARLGYIGFAADLYGEGKVAANEKEATELMLPLFQDRALLQKRIQAAFEVVRRHPDVDRSKIGGIGFCFGGLTIIELLRSGADVRAVVSFHGVLGRQMWHIQAKEVSIAQSIKGSLLILHGYEDPLVSAEDIAATQKEFNEAGVDWQMNIYGHTAHAFTNPEMHHQEKGLVFQPLSAKRAWRAMENFFEECFS